MTDEQALLVALVDNPGDDQLRLVYADWLEERGDPRGEFLRLELKHRADSSNQPQSTSKERLEELRSKISPVWRLLAGLAFQPRKINDRGPDRRACRYCGYANGDWASLCHDCGKPLDAVVEAPYVCPNPSCESENAASARHCQRCRYPLPLAVGSIVANRYQIEEQGELAGFGFSYKAKNLFTGTTVLINELTGAEPLDFQCLLPFFQREANEWALTQSVAAAPRLLDFVVEISAAYLVLECMEDHAPGYRRFPFDRVVRFGTQICDLLHVMHSHSPPLVTDGLERVRLFISDDGETIKTDINTRRTGALKRELNYLRKEMRRVRVRTVCFADMHLPPERVIGRPQPSSDLYELANILYQMLTASHSEGWQTADELNESLARSDCPIPVEQRWLYELIAANLAEDCRDRFQSAQEFRSVLERRSFP